MNDKFDYGTLAALDPEYEKLTIRYCQHTGKPCGATTINELNELIKIHGEKVTKTILDYTQKAYAPEWIWQNAEGLNNLCIWQPKEYFIFAMSKLMFPAAGGGKTATPEASLDTAFQHKVQAWQNIQEIDTDIVKPIAELCRRIIAKCNPVILSKVLGRCRQTSVARITENLENMTAFHLELEDLLKWLVANMSKLVAEEKHGLANFAGQKMIMGLSTLELEIHREMNDFELIPDKNADTVEMLVGRTYAKTAKAKKDKYSCKPLELSGEQAEVPKLVFNIKQVAKPGINTLHTEQVNKPAFKPTFKLGGGK